MNMPLEKSEHNIKDDRVFVLSSNGKELMYKDNPLHCKMDTETCLWTFQLERGILPGGLKGKFTSFSKALKHASSYLQRRGVEVTGIKD